MKKIITYQEKLGNYNFPRILGIRANNYNIPRKIRELQYSTAIFEPLMIITYQEKLGNYNLLTLLYGVIKIITYQEKLGNYNL